MIHFWCDENGMVELKSLSKERLIEIIAMQDRQRREDMDQHHRDLELLLPKKRSLISKLLGHF